jgi:hypothetical protein
MLLARLASVLTRSNLIMFHHSHRVSRFQFIPDQGWTSGYTQNGSSGVTSSYGGGGQMHGGTGIAN